MNELLDYILGLAEGLDEVMKIVNSFCEITRTSTQHYQMQTFMAKKSSLNSNWFARQLT
ncbi:hypothetical protein BD31_I0732 [Candidatus Nitrosopumilus salaria BD31]|uniref:Uncharacterized protein n=1 Tax=Candidatus Nitrosopumilus salarius BD31 TaxID=859350 RepID=I3D191_9ARCH|nr:hypothetical protein BD31_I0732 [Candidatus Nitrosopumilus salaria BD31]